MVVTSKGINVDVGKLFDQAVEMYEASLKAGIKAQEEATKFISDAVQDMAKPVDFPAQLEKINAQVIPAAQKNIDEAVKLLTRNIESCTDLMKKAVDAGQAKSVEEAQTKTRILWEASLAAIKANTLALTDANAKLLQVWVDLAKQGVPAAAAKK